MQNTIFFKHNFIVLLKHNFVVLFKPNFVVIFKHDFVVLFIHDFVVLFKHNFVALFKGCDRLCKVVKLSMQCCGKLLSISFDLICKSWVLAQILRSKLLLWGSSLKSHSLRVTLYLLIISWIVPSVIYLVYVKVVYA